MTRTTLKDVAAAAGVGLSTASYVLNATGLHKVSPETRERIRAAAQKLRYHPNVFARGLRNGKSSFIGVLVPAIDYSFMPEIIAGIDRTLSLHGYSMVLCTFTSDEELVGKLHVLLQKQVDGIVMKSWDSLPIATLHRMVGDRLPCALVAMPETGGYPAALVDPVSVGRLAARRLLAANHRKVALCAVIKPSGETALRNELAASGAPEPWKLDSRDPDILETLFAGRDRFTAVVTSDPQAVRILQEAHKRRIPVPEAFSVLGIDGTEIGNFTMPRLTSINQPRAAQGVAAAEILLEWLSSGRRPENRVLQPTISERESVAPPPGDAEPA